MLFNDLVAWIETLPYWQKRLAKRILDNNVVDDSFIETVYSEFKKEVGLDDDELMIQDISFDEQIPDGDVNAIWKAVGKVKGVNRLKSDDDLQISRGLTLVYGENGSGKSGYTRLLNQAFVSRGDKEIIGNIYEERPDNLYAEFLFEIDGTECGLKYPDEKDNAVFRKIMTFDSKSATDDMLKESEISFIPTELHFFDAFLSAYIRIQQKLDEECNGLQAENPLLKYFKEDSVVIGDVIAISKDTNIEELKGKYALTEEDKKDYESVKKSKASLQALNYQEQLNKIKRVRDVVDIAIERAGLFNSYISKKSLEEYENAIAAYTEAKRLLEEEGINQFKDDGIEKLGSDEWKEFISAAKKYYETIVNHDKCPLCGQDLDGNTLLEKYWRYLKSVAENNVKKEQANLQKIKKNFEELDLHVFVESSIQEEWLNSNVKHQFTQVKEQFLKADKIKKDFILLIENQKYKEIEVEIIDVSILQEIRAIIVEKEKEIDAETVKAKIVELEAKEQVYLDKQKIVELLPVAEKYVSNQKWLALAVKNKIKQKAITNKQKELFDKYVTADYLSTFEDECQKLNAKFDAEIVQRGSKGTTLKKLSIKGLAPGKILSEGEQRAIAIANFMTEVQMDSKNIGVVFDDPVCSLDHKRRNVIAERLLDEAAFRQVVIFTHDITFFMELKTLADKRGISYLQETIRKIAGIPGNIKYNIPWQGMNVKDRIRKLNSDLQEISKLEKNGDDDYFYRAKEWCELLRESWERAVEEILLNDAIQRYNPCVQTQRLRKAPFTIMLYTELEEGMSECSSWVHDRARALNGDIPSSSELKKYIESFEKFVKDNRG